MEDYSLRALLPYIGELAALEKRELGLEIVGPRQQNGRADDFDLRRLLILAGSEPEITALTSAILEQRLSAEEASRLLNGLGQISKTLLDYHSPIRAVAERLNEQGMPVTYRVAEIIYFDY